MAHYKQESVSPSPHYGVALDQPAAPPESLPRSSANAVAELTSAGGSLPACKTRRDFKIGVWATTVNS